MRHPLRHHFIIGSLALALILGFATSAVAAVSARAAAPPSVPALTGVHTAPAFLDKTRFLAHVGAAYFAFHHWAYTPYKKGAFRSGAKGRTAAIVKAGIATLFAYHELKVAYGIAQRSHSALLHALTAPVSRVLGVAGAVGARLKSGHYSAGDLDPLRAEADRLSRAATRNGSVIKDVPAPIPGL